MEIDYFIPWSVLDFEFLAFAFYTILSNYRRPFKVIAKLLTHADLRIATDASTSFGIGGRIGQFKFSISTSHFPFEFVQCWKSTGNHWPPSINVLEFFAAAAAFWIWIQKFDPRRVHVTMWIDNKSAIAWLNHRRCPDFPLVNRMIMAMENVKQKRSLRVSYVWISTSENVIADKLSRGKSPSPVLFTGVPIDPDLAIFPFLNASAINTWMTLGCPKVKKLANYWYRFMIRS